MIRINNTQYFHFLEQADALRRSGLLCDAIISVKSQTFRAHRLVLACASRILAQQLAQSDIDSPSHCTLEYFSPHTFQQVLDFTYTQTLEVSKDDLSLLLRAAQMLEMHPLEVQCKKQLEELHCRERTAEIRAVKEEDESEEEISEEETKGQVEQEEDERRQQCSPVEDVGCKMVTENNSNPDPANSSPTSPMKKTRLSPLSHTRGSVIARPASSTPSFSSPWTFPPNIWSSVSTLRRIAEYSNLIHPIQTTNQLPHSTPYVLPFIGNHFQNSVMAYPAFHPRYPQSLYTGSTGMGSIIKHSLLKRKKHSQRMFTTAETGHQEVPKAGTERAKSCRHCNTSPLADPADSLSTSPGEMCARCRFCGRAEVGQHEPQSRRQEHRGEKPYQCQRCPKKFSLKHQLTTHHRVHTGEKPFECRLCGQRSRDYSAMIKHLRTHGGAAPYQCTVCLEFCSSLVAMQRHIKGHAVHDFPPDWSINSTYLYTSHI